MLKETFLEFFERDLTALHKEISLYADESKLWVIDKSISNSAGNLCLHLIGNLNHFIGSALGNTGYVRERDKEFSTKNVPRQELLQMIEQTKTMVIDTIGKMSESDFQKDLPEGKWHKKATTDYLVVQMFAHLSYHLGQINYHRRLLS